jgi:hypothetical protein
MLDVLIDKIFVQFGGLVFQQTIDIPMVRIMLRYSLDYELYYYVLESLRNRTIYTM